MTAFDTAWALLKAPFVPIPDSTMDQNLPKYKPFEGTLYSGGDANDTPQFWSKDPKLALAYSLFGSAVPITDYESWFRGHGGYFDSGHAPPMRQTVPTIRVSRSAPDWEDYINVDPHTNDGYSTDDNITTEQMSREDIEAMIDEAIQGRGRYWRDSDWQNDAIYGTSARHHTDDERMQHMIEAKQRLESGEAGLLDIPDDAIYKPLMSFGGNDNIEDWIDESPSELANWQLQRLLNDTMFEGLPHAKQEHMDEMNRRKGWVE